MMDKDECCLLCLETFPVAPTSSRNTSISLNQSLRLHLQLVNQVLAPNVTPNQVLPVMQKPQASVEIVDSFNLGATRTYSGYSDGMATSDGSGSVWLGEQTHHTPGADLNQMQPLIQQPLAEADLVEKLGQSPTRTCSGNIKINESGNRSGSESTCFDGESDCSLSSKAATTMMICNIPCRVTQDDITKAIEAAGFSGTYDFVYLPDRRGSHSRGRSSGNLGYAFVDFKNSQHAEDFIFSFESFQFPGTNSAKKCTVKYAHEQGFNANNLARARSKGQRIALW